MKTFFGSRFLKLSIARLMIVFAEPRPSCSLKLMCPAPMVLAMSAVEMISVW